MPVAIVTGASSGIGAAVARRLIDNGWQVGMIARRADRMAALAGASALAVPCDVTDDRGVAAAFDAVDARFGRIDLLFNNAGVFPPPATIDAMTVADWRAAVDVNLTGMFICAREAFARMRAQSPQGGRIIMNGSVSAQAPRPGAAAYTATKHAITGLTKQIALDGRPFGIACGQIDIGNVRSPLADHLGVAARQPDGSLRPEPMMEMTAVVDAVWYMATLPPGANVLSMTVMATAMPLVGRG